MIEIKGKSVFEGIAIGRLSFFNRQGIRVKRYHIDDVAQELQRFEQAKEQTIKQLDSLYEKALGEVGKSGAQIFEVHKMMVEDIDFNEAIIGVIKSQKVNTEFAVAQTGDNFAEMFSHMQDDYMRERASDVKDIADRIIKNLMNKTEDGVDSDEDIIVCADDLAPSETIQMDKSRVVGFVTMGGSSNSHTAILARTMFMPALIGTGEALKTEFDNRYAVIDGFNSTLYIDPDNGMIEKMKQKQAEVKQQRNMLQQLRGKEDISLDGHKIMLYANIGGVKDLGLVYQNDAQGVGLFRSEFLYLESKDYPTEDYQFSVYKTALEKMSGKKVIIRTLDIGADKQIDYFNLAKEENPALGYRAIRICLNREDIFKTQLRALLRASAYGKMAIMFPMITSVEEIEKIKTILEQVKQELRAKNQTFDENIETGIMIETPASVIISDKLAEMVDFFSIGTNDLTQYTLAIDRQNPELEKFCNPHHTALLRMIKMTAENAHKCGKWVGICGELGSDLSLTEFFLALGIDELSVSPGLVLPVREKIRNTGVKGREKEIIKTYVE